MGHTGLFKELRKLEDEIIDEFKDKNTNSFKKIKENNDYAIDLKYYEELLFELFKNTLSSTIDRCSYENNIEDYGDKLFKGINNLVKKIIHEKDNNKFLIFTT